MLVVKQQFPLSPCDATIWAAHNVALNLSASFFQTLIEIDIAMLQSQLRLVYRRVFSQITKARANSET